LKKIHVRLVGGLGNQLYQFSYAYYVYQYLNADQIILNTSAMGNYKENWGLLLFDVIDKNRTSFVECSQYSRFLRLGRFLSFSSKFARSLGYLTDANVNIKNYPKRNDIYLDGYFEGYKLRCDYLNMLRPLLREDLFFNIPDDVVVVNVRGGEFLRHGRSSEHDKEFYLKALSTFNERYCFWLVSDDLEYAHNLLGSSIKFDRVLEPDPFVNFRVIYSAKNKVLSKSTFSKWAGFLSSEFSNSVFLEDF